MTSEGKKKSFIAVSTLTINVVSSNSNNINSTISKCNETIIDFTNQTSQSYIKSSVQSAPDNPVEHHFLSNNLSNILYIFDKLLLYICIYKNKLQSWIIEYKVSHNCGNSLLGILKTKGLCVPKM